MRNIGAAIVSEIGALTQELEQFAVTYPVRTEGGDDTITAADALAMQEIGDCLLAIDSTWVELDRPSRGVLATDLDRMVRALRDARCRLWEQGGVPLLDDAIVKRMSDMTQRVLRVLRYVRNFARVIGN